MVSNAVFHQRRPGLLGEMAEFRGGAGKEHDELEIPPTRKYGGDQKMTWMCQKNMEVNLKGLPLVQYGTFEHHII